MTGSTAAWTLTLPDPWETVTAAQLAEMVTLLPSALQTDPGARPQHVMGTVLLLLADAERPGTEMVAWTARQYGEQPEGVDGAGERPVIDRFLATATVSTDPSIVHGHGTPRWPLDVTVTHGEASQDAVIALPPHLVQSGGAVLLEASYLLERGDSRVALICRTPDLAIAPTVVPLFHAIARTLEVL